MTKTAAEPKKLSIRTLHADPDNARAITAKAQDGLKVSTKEFGDLSGIVFNDLTGELVCGHQRVRVLRRAGAKDWVRVSDAEGYIEHPETGERFKVRIVEWDDVKARAANLAANNPEIQGTYTEDAIDQLRGLEQELQEYDDLAFGDLQAGLEDDLRKGARAAREAEPTDDNPGEDAFMVIVTCADEKHQRETIERFTRDGYKVRALT